MIAFLLGCAFFVVRFLRKKILIKQEEVSNETAEPVKTEVITGSDPQNT